MTVTAVRKDPEALTMTLTAEFDATPERVWQLWADPRQLERWWGPPTYPATFTKHDLSPGSRVEYHMTGPRATSHVASGISSRSTRRARLVFRDGFANEDGTPEPRPPAQRGAGHDRADRRRPHPDVDPEPFPSPEAMEQVLAMGMEEGLREAVGQIDAILAEDTVVRRDRARDHRRPDRRPR